MRKLISSKYSLSVNEKGFITQWSGLENISEEYYIYPVIFKSYTRENPFCRSLDVNSDIDIIECNDDMLKFTKTIEKFQVHFMIKVHNSKFEYNMKLEPWSVDYEFGVAIPVPVVSWTTAKDDVALPFAVYSPFFREDFADQTTLNKPLLHNSSLCIFGDLEKPYSFFQYTDQNSKAYLRVTSPTSNNMNGVSIYSQQEISPAECFPNELSKEANDKLTSLADTTGLEISRQEVRADKITVSNLSFSSSPVADKNIIKFCDLFQKEHEKYPKDFMSFVGIKGIYLGYLISAQDSRAAWGDEIMLVKGIKWSLTPRNASDVIRDWLIFDVYSLNKEIIHHEIFHCLQLKLSLDDYIGYVPAMEHHRLTKHYQQHHTKEYLAEFFALIMVDENKSYVKDPETYTYLTQQIDDVVKINWRLDHNNDKGKNNMFMQLSDGSVEQILFGQLPNKHAYFYINNKPEDLKKLKILATARSGSSLLAQLLNCSKKLDINNNLIDAQLTIEEFRNKSTNLLDDLHAQHCTNIRYIWLLRHPLEVASSLKKNYDIDYEEGLDYWETINLIIWYFLKTIDAKFTIKFEEILMNKSKVMELFNFAGVRFYDQYLSYGDFDQPDIDQHEGRIVTEKVSYYKKQDDLLQTWKDYKNNPIILETGYSQGVE